MADFEPYPDLPGGDVPSPEALNVSRSNATWAKTFERGTTNLSQRARHAQDIRQYTADLSATREAEQARRIATDKGAHDMWMKERAATLNETKTYEAMRLARERAAEAMRIAPLVFEAKKAQIASQVASAARTAAETRRAADLEIHADNYLATLAEMPIDATPDQEDDFRDAAAKRFPGAAKHPKTMGDVTIARANLAARRTIQARTEAATVADARKVAALDAKPDAPGKPAKDPELDQLKSTLALGLSNQKKAKLEEQPKYEPGLLELRKKIAEKENATPAAAVPPSSASDYIKSKLGLK